MSEVQEGKVRKVFANTKDKRGGCSVYIEGKDGALYCNAPYKAEDFPEGAIVEFVISKPAGKGYAVEKIRVKPASPDSPATSATVIASKAPPKEQAVPVQMRAEGFDERQRMIIVQSCQKVAVDMLKLYMEKEAFTLGAAVNKRKAVIDAFYNGLVYDLFQQVINGPVKLDGKPEDAKPEPKAKKPVKGKEADAEPESTNAGDGDTDMDDLP